MKKRFPSKRGVALLLTFLFMFAFSFAASAADCELKLSDAAGCAGIRTNLTLSVGNNPGISNGILFIRYDPELLSVDGEDISLGEVGAKFEITEKVCRQGVVTLGFVNRGNVTDDGILFVLPFTVALNAYPTKTKIDIEVKELVGADGRPVEVNNLSAEFDISEPPPYTLGDVNGDGEADIADAMLVLYHVAKKEQLSNVSLLAANINKDGTVDIEDAMRLLYFVANKSPTL